MQAAGTFLNGPDRDKGPSDLAIDHVFQANGMVELPYQIQVSGIFRAQSGFHFSRAPASGVLVDPDGDASVNAIDVNAGRNAFTTPPFVNLDMRFAKRFNVTSGRQGAGAARVLQRVQPPEPRRGGPPAGRGARAVRRADASAAGTRGADRFPDRVLKEAPRRYFIAAFANNLSVASSVGGCNTLVAANCSACG